MEHLCVKSAVLHLDLSSVSFACQCHLACGSGAMPHVTDEDFTPLIQVVAWFTLAAILFSFVARAITKAAAIRAINLDDYLVTCSTVSDQRHMFVTALLILCLHSDICYRSDSCRTCRGAGWAWQARAHFERRSDRRHPEGLCTKSNHICPSLINLGVVCL